MQKAIYILVLFSVNFLMGQIDRSGGTFIGRSIEDVDASGIPIEEPISLEFDNSHIGFQKAKQELDKQRQQQREKEKEEQKGILTSQHIAKQRFKKNIEGHFFNFPQIDMELGSFHTKSKHIHISSYDFGQFDGDKVQITVNGKRIHNNYLLTPQIKVISAPLSLGINKIEVTALNEGRLVPNTGYFSFFDDNRYIIKEGEWMLATGAKVIAIVVREDED